jgi:predicted aspartyl protease
MIKQSRLLSLTLVALCTVTLVAAGAGGQTRQIKPPPPAWELAQAVQKAYGGLQKIKEIDDTVVMVTGTARDFSTSTGASNSTRFRNIELRDDFRHEHFRLGQPELTMFANGRLFTKTRNDVFFATPAELKEQLEENEHDLINVLQIMKASNVRLDDSIPQYRDRYWTLAVSHPAGKTFLAIDPQTKLVRLASHMVDGTDPFVKVLFEQEYLDHKTVNGFPFFGTERGYLDNKKLYEDKIQSRIFPKHINPDWFALPKEDEPVKRDSVIPINFDGKHIFTPVSINGSKPQNFLIDTGASRSIISSDCALSTGISAAAGAFNVNAGAGNAQIASATVRQFKFGDVIMEQLPVFVSNAIGTTVTENADGIIGANILRRFQVTFDYMLKQMTLRAPNKPLPAKGIAVPTKIRGSNVYLRAKINNNRDYTFILDTGASQNVIPEALAGDLLKDAETESGYMIDASGKHVPMRSVVLKSLDFGALHLGPTRCVIVQTSHPVCILGNPVLSLYKVTVDYWKEKVLFD